MKFVFVFYYRLLAFLIMLLIFSGCATHYLNTDIPPLQTGSPLRSLPAKTFAFKKFTDSRGTDEVSTNWGAHHYKLDKPATTVVAEAIQKELVRNGHKYIPTTEKSKADFIIEGIVNKYWFDFTQPFGTDTVANVIVKLTVSTLSNNSKREYSKSYEGEYMFEGHASWNGGYDYGGKLFSDILNRALMRLVGEISRDVELISFIKNK